MAALNPVYWETISEGMKSILEFLGQQDFCDRFYLAGGTALALQLGHRKSIDLDFFSELDEVLKGSRQQILVNFMKSQLSTNVLENEDGNLLLQVNQIQVGFFSYGYPLLDPAVELIGCRLASILDIGLMKLDAVISRGSRKDFYDLYWIAKQISLPELLQSGDRKYPMMRDFPLMAVEHLVAFDNADRDQQPDLLKDIQWEEVKVYFIQQAKQLGNSWFLKKE